MKLLALAALAQIIVSPIAAVVIENFERALPSNQTLHVNGHDIVVVTRPASTTAFSNITARSPAEGTKLVKRVTNNACFYGCSTTCTNGLSPLPTPPTLGDCTILRDAVDALAVSRRGTTFPCNLPNQASCPTFTVAPGWEQMYTYGTCLVGFINLNPVGGPNIAFCDYLVAGTMLGIYDNCITTAGNTGGFCAQTLSPGYVFALEVRHV